VRATVFLTFEMKARDVAEDLEPRRGVAPNLDLRLAWAKGKEGLVEQVAHDSRLGLVACGAHIVDRQVIVNPQVALDKAGHLPLLTGPIEAFEDEDVAARGGAAVALAASLPIRVGECGADGVTQSRGVVRLGRTDTVRQTCFFHGAPCRTA
jgi:hypothetical protein